jgi:hypothetical protein
MLWTDTPKRHSKKRKEEVMNDRFDQLAKGLVQSTTRRQALKRFAGGLAAMALAGFALPSKPDRTCLPSGNPCVAGGPKDNCNKCCSGTHFCFVSEDTGRQCFCN